MLIKSKLKFAPQGFWGFGVLGFWGFGGMALATYHHKMSVLVTSKLHQLRKAPLERVVHLSEIIRQLKAALLVLEPPVVLEPEVMAMAMTMMMTIVMRTSGRRSANTRATVMRLVTPHRAMSHPKNHVAARPTMTTRTRTTI